MKKTIYFLLSCLTLSSCSIFRDPAILESSTVDYSAYDASGMFLTEVNTVNFTYTPIGNVSAINLSGYEVKGALNRNYNDDTFQTTQSKTVNQTTNRYITATRQNVLDKMVKEAKSKGANGIVNLKIKAITVYSEKTGFRVAGYEADGMAIKR